MIYLLFQLLCLIVYVFVVTGTLYLLVFAVAGRMAGNIQLGAVSFKKKIIVLIPCYKEDNVILETARKSAKHNYPSSSFQVLVIADSLRDDTIQQLKRTPVGVLEVKFDLSTKAKSLHAALMAMKNRFFDIAMILDADNIMEDGCLEQVNSVFHQGRKAVQCHRSAKNKNTPVALLDAISEEININLFRRGPQALGLSAMPLGSGMAFDFNLLKDIFETPGILENPAEDREIEIQLMKRNISMEFLNHVYIYDEKVSEARVFEKQRTRWMEAQLNQVRRFFKSDLDQTTKTAGYYHIFFQCLLLPRLLYLFVCCVVTLTLTIQWVFAITLIYPSPVYWTGWIITYFIVLIVSVPPEYFTAKTLKAIAYIPLLMISMLKAILKLKKNRKEFLHTTKTYNAE